MPDKFIRVSTNLTSKIGQLADIQLRAQVQVQVEVEVEVSESVLE